MVSKSIIKLVHSLEMKKNRRSSGLFVAEGPKVVGDLIGHYRLHSVIALSSWIEANGSLLGDAAIYEASDEELRKTSLLQHPQEVVALFEMASKTAYNNEIVELQIDKNIETSMSDNLVERANSCLILALDGVQDPGNLGTIIRIADWFGIDTIVCSPSTADAFNPKVVQATMGSIARVHILYKDIVDFLQSLPPSLPVYGTLLDGENIYSQELSASGVIVMGNEGNGISPEVRQRVNRRLLIPDFHRGSTCAESLNVAIATAITCSEFRRRYGRGRMPISSDNI